MKTFSRIYKIPIITKKYKGGIKYSGLEELRKMPDPQSFTGILPWMSSAIIGEHPPQTGLSNDSYSMIFF